MVSPLKKMLRSSVHPTGYKNLIATSYALADRDGKTHKKDIKPLLSRAIELGKKWAHSFMPWMEKTGALRIKGFDAEQYMDKLYDRFGATSKDQVQIRNALEQGRTINSTRSVARTIMANVYVRASLEEWKANGITHVKRMEMHDDKVSKVCRGLNGTIWKIDDLLKLDEPLTHHSHQNCRGTFTAYFGSGKSRQQLKQTIPINQNFGKFENAPIEYIPWLRGINKFISFDKVVFEELGPKVEIKNGVMHLNPDDNDDIRELMLTLEAEKRWPKIKKDFMELEVLMDHDMIPRNKFRDLFREYALGQLSDEPVLQMWFRTHIK